MRYNSVPFIIAFTIWFIYADYKFTISEGF